MTKPQRGDIVLACEYVDHHGLWRPAQEGRLIGGSPGLGAAQLELPKRIWRDGRGPCVSRGFTVWRPWATLTVVKKASEL